MSGLTEPAAFGLEPVVLFAIFWVFAASLVAFLPYRRQMVPGTALLLAAPFVIAGLGFAHGPLIALCAVAAFVSMFRRPLAYYGRRALGPARRQQEGEEP